jgi:putative Mg2+ transporter-C (MgtC) family protein
MFEDLTQFLHVLGAAFLTGLVGWERESKDIPAGFRTNMVVGAAAALLVILGQFMVQFYDAGDRGAQLQYDPLRVVEAIIVGISFIGAGTILKSEAKQRIQYLTSAATILISAAIGIAVALERYFLAGMVTLMVLLINRILRRLEKKHVVDAEK